MIALGLALAAVLVAPAAAGADMRLAPGFAAQAYVTGEGFGGARGVSGIPSVSSLVVDATGTLFLGRTGRRYFGGEVEDVWPIYRIPPGGGRLTRDAEARFLYGPPLPNPHVAAAHGPGELLVTTFDRERAVGVLYRILDGRAELLAGGTPPRGTPALLKQPEGAAMDAGGHLYVADRQQHVVLKLDARGRVLDPRWLAVARPRLIAAAGDRVWVAADGEAEAPWQRGTGEIWTAGPAGPPRVLLRGPIVAGISPSPAGRLFLADRQGARIVAVGVDGATTEIATFTDGDAPRALGFAPVTEATRRAGIAGDLFVVVLRRGAWAVNEVVRITGPFDDGAR
jgi:hypothetical protein